jgi:cation diffusion facilitator CzcD-associated flavoprotein CzcO
MQPTRIRCVAVIGAGNMGHGIAQDFAAHGYDVRLFARRQARLDEALRNIENGLAILERLGHLTAQQASETVSRIRTNTHLEDTAPEADFVVEAIAEDLAAKQQIFRTLDSLCPPQTILASTTSSLLPSSLASATQRADRVLVTHYFNPPAMVPLVEVVRGAPFTRWTPCYATSARSRCRHRRKLSDDSAPTSGLHLVPANSMSRAVYPGPTWRPLPDRGTMSATTSLRRDRRARFTKSSFGFATESGC